MDKVGTAGMFLRSEGQQLDFTSGVIDLSDMFNTGVAPVVNKLLVDTGAEDPILESLQDNAEEARTRGVESRKFLAEPAQKSTESTFGFEKPTRTPEQTPSDPSNFDQNFEQDFTLSEEPKSQPESESTPRFASDSSFDAADFTFNREARLDSKGRLKVYNPPSGDGGGAFEVAGITARYQREEATRLRSLIQQGKHEQAKSEAKAFFRKRAEPFTKYAKQQGLQLQLADTVHHRGEGGLRRVLQRATGSKSKSYATLIRQLDSDPEALGKFNKARVDYELIEIDRGRSSRKRFKEGLLNRFAAANKEAQKVNRLS